MTINLYGVASIVSFAILYSGYLAGINPGSIDDDALYVDASFWLHFIIPAILGIAAATTIRHLTRHRPVLGTSAIGLAGAILTIWMYTDVKIYTLFSMHFNRFMLEALLQKDALQQIGIQPATMLSNIWPLFVFLTPHVAIGKLSRIRLGAIERKHALWLLIVSVSLLVPDKLAYSYFYLNARPFVFDLKNSSPFYPVPHSYHIYKFFSLLTGETKAAGFQAQMTGLSIGQESTKNGTNYPVAPVLREDTIGTPYNVVIVAAESLRAFDFDSETAPNLSAISSDVIRANSHFSNGNCTHFGLFSLFYGLNPYYFHDFRVSGTAPVGIQLLKQNDYTLYATLSRTMQWYDLDKFMFGPDFDTFQPNSEDSVITDTAVTDKAIAIAEKHAFSGKPYLNFIYYYATHADYQHPEAFSFFLPEMKGRVDYAERGIRERRTELLNRYRNSIRFVDHETNRLIDAIKKAGAWDNTIFIFTGDHGEEFFEENKYGHNSGLNTFQTQVPFIMHIPTHGSITIDRLTSHMDVFQTVLDAIRAPARLQADFQGVDMLRPEDHPVVVGMAHYQRPKQYAIFHDGLRTIVNLEDGTPRLESVTDSQGNAEKDITVAQSDVLYLLQQLRQFRKQ